MQSQPTEKQTPMTVVANRATEQPAPASPFGQSEGQRALEAIAPFLSKIDDASIRRLPVTPPSLVSYGLYFAELYAEDREVFQDTFQKSVFDVAAFDNMRDRAQAFWHLDILLRRICDQGGRMQTLLAAAGPLRAKLVKAADYLWGDDPDLGEEVAKIRAGNSHLNRADDLGALATLFIDHWDEAETNCNVTEDEVLLAQELGAKMMTALGGVQTKEVSDIRLQRDKAGEYLRQGIEDIRAAACFAFRDDPKALDRYPSIRMAKKKGKPKERAEIGPEGAGQIEVATAVVPTTEVPSAMEIISEPQQPPGVM
ncbi:MAG: hypothetical protein QNJ97_03560 [Myxococcota bacterium]|nr:hypothetical protein [Myxococcota bacterium]